MEAYINNNNTDSNNTCQPRTIKALFKYYKKKSPPPNLSMVLDINDISENAIKIDARQLSSEMLSIGTSLGLNDLNLWKIYKLQLHPGLYIIRNAFTEDGRKEWERRCVLEFSSLPHVTNISNKESNWWTKVSKFLISDTPVPNKLLGQLRWSTMGYQHNWDTKEYSESRHSAIPNGIQDMCQIVLHVAGLPDAQSFQVQAAICNYYPSGATLAPHKDVSEPCKDAPLISFSFGRSGIFLIGGLTEDAASSALFLHSSDIMIMCKEARLSYHAVSRICHTVLNSNSVAEDCKNNTSNSEKNNNDDDDRTDNLKIDSSFGSDKLNINNIKKRRNEIFFNNDFSIKNKTSANKVNKSVLKSNITSAFEKNIETSKECSNEESGSEKQNSLSESLAIQKYLELVRINLNVRQILHRGQTKLES